MAEQSPVTQLESIRGTEMVSVRAAEAAVRLAKEAKTHLEQGENLFNDPTMAELVAKMADTRFKPDGPTVAEMIQERTARRLPKEFADSENLARDVVRAIITELSKKMPSEFGDPSQLSWEDRLDTIKASFTQPGGLHTSPTIAWLGIGNHGVGQQLAIRTMHAMHDAAPYAISWLKAAGIGTMYNKDGGPNPRVGKHIPTRTYVAWMGDNLNHAIRAQLAAIKQISGEAHRNRG